MPGMLGNSRTWRWRLCGCRNCRGPGDSYRSLKRSARQRETRLWRREQT